MIQEIEMTTNEQLDMYMKCSKKELCKMLIEANKHLKRLHIPVVMFNETEICTTCLKPRNTQPNILQPLCECDYSKVKLVCDNCYGTGVSKSDLNSITTCSDCLGSGKQTK